MRKLYSLILLFTATCTFAWDGAGTKENPYKIATPQDLVDLSTTVKTDNRYAGTYFLMMGDINMTDVNFTPIGKTYAFEGNFDGGNHVISNLKIVPTKDFSNVGLFGSVDAATVENITIINSYFEGYNNTAAIAGYSKNSSIRNCHNHATVKGNSKYSQYIGGVIGELRGGTVENCSNAGLVIAEGENAKYIAGVVGSTIGASAVINCRNSGTVKGTSSVGGVVGIVGNDDSLTGSYNTGVVIGTGEYAGGVAGEVKVGLLSTGGMSGCYNAGKVHGNRYVGGIAGTTAYTADCCNVGDVSASGTAANSGNNVGGIAGSGHVANCYNIASVSGNNSVGGVIGNISKAENCYNLGAVTGTTNVGGVAGYMSGDACEMTRCYSAGTVAASEAGALIGGIVGSINLGGFINNNTIQNSFWDTDRYPGQATSTNVAGDTDFTMTGKSTAYMKTELAGALAGPFLNQANAYPTLSGTVGSLNPGQASTVYTINAAVSANGQALFTGEMQFAEGSSLLYTTTPGNGYAVASFKVDGVDKGHITSFFFDEITGVHLIEVTFGDVSGISGETMGYAIYPRATNGKFFIEGAAGSRITVFDIAGKTVKAKFLNTDNETIETTGWAKGLYLIRIEKGAQINTCKIVKQ